MNGQREVGLIDLTSKQMFNSPFYHLQQNDVVMVEQTGRPSVGDALFWKLGARADRALPAPDGGSSPGPTTRRSPRDDQGR